MDNQVGGGKFFNRVSCRTERDAFHPSSVRCFDAWSGIFDHDACIWAQLQSARGFQENIWMRLPS